MHYGSQGQLRMRNSFLGIDKEKPADETKQAVNLDEIGQLQAEIACLVEEKAQLIREIAFFRSGIQVLAVSEQKYRVLLREAGKALHIARVQNDGPQASSWRRWLTRS
jgi:hypothetical protein